MAEYQSSYTGAEIDAGIAKANTALQPADLSSKQDTLVSGTNIKTVNGTSLLGSGNLATGLNYSTTEQNTGLKWIDGKDIYQKTYVVDNPTANNAYHLIDSSLNSSNTELLISYEFTVVDTLDGLFLMSPTDNDHTGATKIGISSTFEGLSYWIASNQYFKKVILTVKYVKKQTTPSE